jgi:nucleoside 2-deoxyribosyltransferase
MSELKVYFAGSIRGGRKDQAICNQLIEAIKAQGATVLCEHVGYANLTQNGQNQPPDFIHNRDLSWIAEANCAIAEVTNPSLGVGYEIHHALTLGKPVLCLFAKVEDGHSLSAMIAGAPNMYHTLKIFEYTRDIAGMAKAKVAISDFLTGVTS